MRHLSSLALSKVKGISPGHARLPRQGLTLPGQYGVLQVTTDSQPHWEVTDDATGDDRHRCS